MDRAFLTSLAVSFVFQAHALAKEFDFCTLRGLATHAADASVLWDAETVQTQTRQAAVSARVSDTPLAAYPISYVRMTEERDRERCGGMLAIPDRASRLIGDLLADYMSRWLVKSTQDCELEQSGGVQTGICGAMRRSITKRLPSLASAMDMTSVYLSSHMASALVAVLYDDEFWNQEFPRATHCVRRPCGEEVMAARVSFVRAYKPYYDLNNRFLAKNLHTVMGTLTAACHIRGTLASASAHVLERFPLELLFGRIRDTTFSAAIAALPLVDPKTHPMLAFVEGRYTGQFEVMREWRLPQPLAEAEATARDVLTNSLVRSGLGLLGGRSWEDLRGTPPSGNSQACPFFE